VAVAAEQEDPQELPARREKLLPWIIGAITTFLVVGIGKLVLDRKSSLGDTKNAQLTEEQEWAMRRAAHPEFSDS
jgi:hypothetical protein